MAENARRWLNLTTKFGKVIDNPSGEDLSRAIEELGAETLPKKSADEGAEHTSAWLSYEIEGGPRFNLSVSQDGTTTLTKFISQDADDPSEELSRKVSLKAALALWTLLAKGSEEKVEAELAKGEATGSK